MTAVSQRLLAEHGGLRGLYRLDVVNLARIRGLGDAKSVRVKAALELGRRLAALSPQERPKVASPDNVAISLDHLIGQGSWLSLMRLGLGFPKT